MKNKYLALLIAVVLMAMTSFIASAEPININTATAKEMAVGLKGIGPKKAEAIVAYREEQGLFQTINEITQVPGIGPSTLRQNRDNLTIGEMPQKTTTPNAVEQQHPGAKKS